MTGPADIVNQALEYGGNQDSVTYSGGVWNGSLAAAHAAAVLYVPTWQMVARQLDPDFARRTAPLNLQEVGSGLPPGWAYGYNYPSDCLRLRQIAARLYDPFDPQLISANVGFDVILGTSLRLIFCNETDALAVYTSSDVVEDNWDTMFTMAVVRQLANPFSMALEGRPDYAREILAQAAQYEQLAELVDESSTGG